TDLPSTNPAGKKRRSPRRKGRQGRNHLLTKNPMMTPSRATRDSSSLIKKRKVAILVRGWRGRNKRRHSLRGSADARRYGIGGELVVCTLAELRDKQRLVLRIRQPDTLSSLGENQRHP